MVLFSAANSFSPHLCSWEMAGSKNARTRRYAEPLAISDRNYTFSCWWCVGDLYIYHDGGKKTLLNLEKRQAKIDARSTALRNLSRQAGLGHTHPHAFGSQEQRTAGFTQRETACTIGYSGRDSAPLFILFHSKEQIPAASYLSTRLPYYTFQR